ncbi:hypothetical protein CBS101457_006472 [Exobasidium rhododendri]|nr:hypothetical protein CBS101457_006472 [Exobasidium rhododendri]
MTHPWERQVFEPDAVPRQRNTSQRKVTFKCCIKIFAALIIVFSILVVSLIGRAVYAAKIDFTSAHSDLKRANVSGVRPLVNTTDRFDVLATVWLDVTQHLATGGTLPDDVKVVQYKSWNGVKRSEAILYSDLLVQNATMQSKVHATARVRLPIEPLYTQALGPATLRGTFKIIPHSHPEGLQFNASVCTYPNSLPVGPRSPNARMLDDTLSQKPTSIEEALEQSAISVNLLALLSSNWQTSLNESHAHLRDDMGVDPSIFDGSPSNRAFANSGSSTSIYARKDHRILLPHIRTRSRVMLIKEERILPIPEYYRRFWTSKAKMAIDCSGFLNATLNHTSDGRCQRPIQDSIFENWLDFHNSTDESHIQAYYAPYLAQQATSAAYRHHRTIPRFLPNKDEIKASRKAGARKEGNGCLVPLLEMDDSRSYFHFDWDVFFSAHVHMRSSFADTFHSENSDQPTEVLSKDDKSELRIKENAATNIIWNLQSECVRD